ncbi:hypothetical protein WHR41_03030 [Cladosporium halotolerans]|uniref:Uncharacterized protein n=1 Tax=Cladosporium halotolerans TaxID=1052096 RepID=A0AB34KW11_9PEZI
MAADPISTPRVTRRSAAAAAAAASAGTTNSNSPAPPPATPGFRVLDNGKKVSRAEADGINADEQLNREQRMAQKSKRARRRARGAARRREGAASPVKV